ncbi:17826_t:CDS:2, partial [Gigaspora margarita]
KKIETPTITTKNLDRIEEVSSWKENSAQYEENKNRIDQAEMSSGVQTKSTTKDQGSKTPEIKETENPYLEQQTDSTKVINYVNDHNKMDRLNIDVANYETKDTNKETEMQGTAMETSPGNTNQNDLSEKAPKLMESLEIGGTGEDTEPDPSTYINNAESFYAEREEIRDELVQIGFGTDAESGGNPGSEKFASGSEEKSESTQRRKNNNEEFIIVRYGKNYKKKEENTYANRKPWMSP